MSGKTVETLAKEYGLPVKLIIENLAKAGVPGKQPGDTITDDEILNLTHKSAPQSRAKTKVSTLKVGGVRGTTTTVMVRKKRRRRKAAEPPPEEAAKKPEQAAKAEKPAADAKRGAKAKSKAKAAAPAGKAADKAKEVKKKAPAKDAAEKRAKEEPRDKDKGDARRETKKLRVASDKSGKRRPRKVTFRTTPVARPGRHSFTKPQDPVQRTVEIGEQASVASLASQMKVKADVVLRQLKEIGVDAQEDGALDADSATLVVEEMGHTAVVTARKRDDTELLGVKPNTAKPASRPPVVTVMGHVDHGKTTLLDHLRKTVVADGEAGGITQHIGAYRVNFGAGSVTFLDTPGHAAFSAMRVRGAHVTDIVVLVVAADDGVKEQTEESVKHAREAGVPIIVAINKIDKPEADAERVRQELAKLELVPEEWGGHDLFVSLSAKTGEGVDKLLEAILLQAEMMELKAPPSGPARAITVESSLDKAYGATSMVIVKEGVIKKGDFVFAGTGCGRVRLLLDENRKPMKEASPSTPALVVGLSDVPEAGSNLWVVSNERKAREVAEMRKDEERKRRLVPQTASRRLEEFLESGEAGGPSIVNLVVKADVRGSVEALCDALAKLPATKVGNRVISSGTGGITESDISLAMTTGALVLGFNVRADKKAEAMAGKGDVNVRYYSVIYEAVEGVREMMEGLVVPEVREEILGLAEVREVFNSSRLGRVAGSLVVDGSVKRGNPIRVLRDSVVVYEGELESLRRFKDDVNEVVAGTECGIAVKDYNDVKAGDQIEVYERVTLKAEL